MSKSTDKRHAALKADTYVPDYLNTELTIVDGQVVPSKQPATKDEQYPPKLGQRFAELFKQVSKDH